MASYSVLLSEDQLRCSICLQVFTHPVSTPCGHSFCRVCLTTCWGSNARSQCPICRKTFHIRPDLSVNTFINEILGQFRECMARAELKRIQQYEVDVTLDPDTANPWLSLSDNGKQVRDDDVWKNLPDNPERFDVCPVVLGQQSFSSGRFYYEVQVEGNEHWVLGVATESANRKGVITLSPEDGYWTVCLSGGHLYMGGGGAGPLALTGLPQKVGVFVDYEEGRVSFYDVMSASHIFSHTDCTFTEGLYPIFRPGSSSCPLIITPVTL